MWKAGLKVEDEAAADDDWDTDPDFVNTVSEKQQRWGSKTVEGSGKTTVVDLKTLREQVAVEDKKVKQETRREDFSHGYGGAFGVQKDRMDKAAVGLDYVADKAVHSSQVDGKKGFGGQYGLDARSSTDKAALGYDADTKTSAHASVTDSKKGFGGQFGKATVTDKAALGFDDMGLQGKHSSQTDSSKGFGGKYGVQAQTDKAAQSFDSAPAKVGSTYEKPKIVGGASSARAAFEKMAQGDSDDTRRRAEEAAAARRRADRALAEQERERQGIRAEEEPAAPAPAPVPKAAPKVVAPPPEPEPEPEQEQEPEPEPAPAQPAADEWADEPAQDADDTPGEVIKAAPEAGSGGKRARALYDYQAGGEDEVTFDPEEIIEDIEEVDEGWWMGTVRGKRGLFPSNYVELI